MSPYDFLSSHHYTYSYHVTSSFDQQFLSFWGQRTDRQTDRQTDRSKTLSASHSTAGKQIIIKLVKLTLGLGRRQILMSCRQVLHIPRAISSTLPEIANSQQTKAALRYSARRYDSAVCCSKMSCDAFLSEVLYEA